MPKPLRIVKLTIPELTHLLGLIEANTWEGAYYGPREQYWERSRRIAAKLSRASGNEPQVPDSQVDEL